MENTQEKQETIKSERDERRDRDRSAHRQPPSDRNAASSRHCRFLLRGRRVPSAAPVTGWHGAAASQSRLEVGGIRPGPGALSSSSSAAAAASLSRHGR